jgi:hypothetical protein
MTEITDHDTTVRYLRPGWFTRHVFNRSLRWCTRRGWSVAGSSELRLPGRRSGAARTTVVNVLDIGDQRDLVAPRGTTE